MVIDLSTKETESFPSPVVGAAGLDLPTSGDVHLYSDPQTSKSNNPILFADCEGLEGGERVPLGARFKRRDKASNIGRIGSFEKKVQRAQHTSEREITWADSNAKKSREFAVTQLYPRLLYTFSDVIVFVLKNPRSVIPLMPFRSRVPNLSDRMRIPGSSRAYSRSLSTGRQVRTFM